MRALPLRSAFAVATLLLAQVVCGQSPAPASTVPLDPLTEAIRERVDHLRYESDQDARGDRIVLRNVVSQYFEQQQFRSSWSDPVRLDHLIAALIELRSDGLDPTDYHVNALQSYRADLRAQKELSPIDRADLELLATDAMVLACYHLYRGKVDPVKLSSQWNFMERPAPDADPLSLVAQAISTDRIREAFDASRPQHAWYSRGRERLREYRAIEAAGGWPSLPEGPTLKPGMSDPRVPTLRRRLQITKDLGPSGAVPMAPDLYDVTLEQAVRAFQARHGLEPDGAVGPGTRGALNVPVAQRIDQIRVNLERARWVLHELQGEFVLVDVAGFYVSYFKNDEPVWTSRVVVGKQGRETPIFKSKITYVVLNPTWTIPPGILVKDKLPILRRDPGYLKRTRIKVISSSGVEVDPYSVNWSAYSASRLPPYQFVQAPGPDNALGLVKIMFPNPHMVYLHDSPAKELFDLGQRTFSSGCIRVQKPFELAELVLSDQVKWNRSAIDAAIATGKTQTVNLAAPLPVLILYWTAQPRADGQVIFRNDVYGRDPGTLKALDSDFRLPAGA
jgi:murein L,D-transpeptidase YcbB/YkuD